MTHPVPVNPPRAHGDPSNSSDVFNPKADIRGGNVVRRGPDPEWLGRAPRNAPPQQPGSQNHYMGKKGHADDPKTAALLRRLKGKDSK